MKVNIFLQVRSSSQRLPFKALADIGNMPLFVLCAKRLANTGINVVVLTSTSKDDDQIVQISKKYNLNYFRGPLKNVFKRFYNCSKNFSCNDIIIRATGDNPFNDGKLANLLLKFFIKNKLSYLNANAQGLPYGCGLEVMSVKKLRSLIKLKLNKKDKEHVTYRFQKKSIYFKDLKKKINLNKNYSHLRATIDYIEDYVRISNCFINIKKPINVSWKKLIKILEKNNINFLKKNKNKNKIKKYQIGGAQIGMNYGFDKKIKPKQIKIIINNMNLNHFNSLDTASTYGSSEREIGKNIFKSRKPIYIFTKNKINIENINEQKLESLLFVEFYKSLSRLRVNNIHCLYAHDAICYIRNFKIYNNFFKILKKLKLIYFSGVSIYEINEFKYISRCKEINYIQIPINIIDHRWKKINILLLKKKFKFKIVARSIFLRGLLIRKVNENIKVKNLKYIKKNLSILTVIMKCKNVKELCIKYINSINFLDHIIFGINNYNNLKDISVFLKNKFSFNEINKIDNFLKIKKIKYIDARSF